MDSIAKDSPEIALNRDGTLNLSRFWFNTGGVRHGSGCAAGVVPEALCFRSESTILRGPGFIPRERQHRAQLSIGGSRSLQFRLDVQNLFDSVLWSNPTMDPTSSNFGKVTGATNSIMRFFTFVWKVNF